MHKAATTVRVLAVPVVAAAMLAGLAACGSQSPSRPQQPPARVEKAGSRGVPSVVLSPAGASRLGVQTATVIPAVSSGTVMTIPYAALLYEPDGTTVVYTVTGVRTYTRQPIVVSKIVGNVVYLSSGLTAGTEVVTGGAEELLGVQDGVGVQT